MCVSFRNMPLSQQGVEKLLVSRMQVGGSNRRIHAVDRHAGMVSGPNPTAQVGACRRGRFSVGLLPHIKMICVAMIELTECCTVT